MIDPWPSIPPLPARGADATPPAQDRHFIRVAAAGLDRRTEASPPVTCACSDGPGARPEPAEARQARQPPARTVEGAASGVHREALREALRSLQAGARPADRGAGTAERAQERSPPTDRGRTQSRTARCRNRSGG